VEDQQLAEEGLQCHLWEAEVVVEVDQEDSSRFADIARKVEAGEGIEDEVGFVDDAAAVGRDRLAAGSVDRMGVSMAAVAEVVVDSARRRAPWTRVGLEVDELG
jgi:hypothetical protein